MNSRDRNELVLDGWIPPEEAEELYADVLDALDSLGDALERIRQPRPDQDAETLLRQGLAEFICPECGVRTAIHRCPKCDWDGDYSPADPGDYEIDA
jgi:acetone carboxylase gamma subunit